MELDNNLTSHLDKLDQESKRISANQNKFTRIGVTASLLIGIALLVISENLKLTMGFAGVTAVLGSLLYHFLVKEPFIEVKEKFKKALIDKYMQACYPEMTYHYSLKGKKGKKIINRAGFLNMHSIVEEDVIEGRLNEIEFHLSQCYVTEDGDSSIRVNGRKKGSSGFGSFCGMLIELKIPNANFPTSTIVSNVGFFRSTFGGFKTHEKYQFGYVTDDEERLAEETAKIIPFIAYLRTKHKDIKIQLEGNSIVLLLTTDTDFLDEPDLKIGDDLSNEKFYEGMSNHLNSMFFVIESLTGNETPLELEEKLELRIKDKIIRE